LNFEFESSIINRESEGKTGRNGKRGRLEDVSRRLRVRRLREKVS
jgi:hypothetical protein